MKRSLRLGPPTSTLPALPTAPPTIPPPVPPPEEGGCGGGVKVEEDCCGGVKVEEDCCGGVKVEEDCCGGAVSVGVIRSIAFGANFEATNVNKTLSRGGVGGLAIAPCVGKGDAVG
jgi:hypothetical protein